MKKIVLGLIFCCSALAHSEIVINSNGDRVDLKSNGTWALVPWTDADFVNNNEKFTIKVPDGGNHDVDVLVTPDVSLQDDGRRIKRKDLEFEVKLAAITGRYKLKDRYSYVPREVSVKQRGNNVSITISSTAKNSYGADVPSDLTKEYYIEKNGRFTNKSMNDY
ncbi:hypothetical protein [Acinetobacter nectaris]|uniref:hypothetical protein n=1 Tax=Acinetobacter nectaris TaxID=1219382 RepID=UPI001F19E7FA|nr:hypothetical protein [Acinetobacter nectaris]MCF9035196.1 hypothetical protein [Acinetobacter nectaris]